MPTSTDSLNITFMLKSLNTLAVRHATVATLCVWLLLPQTVPAAEYTLQPSLTLRGSYNDNVRMTFNENEEISGHEIKPVLTFNRDDRISVLNLRTEASFDRYNLSRYNTDDHKVALSYRRNLEKGSLSANATTEHTSIRTLEDQDTDIGSIEDVASRAEAHSLALSANYSVTENNVLQGSLSGQTRNYRSETRRGYEYYSANGLWQYVLNPRLRLQTQATYSRYIPDESVGLEFTDILINEAAARGTATTAFDQILGVCINQLLVGVAPLNTVTTFSNFQTPEDVFSCFSLTEFETEQNTVEAKLGFVYRITEKLTLDALVGGSETGGERDVFTLDDRSVSERGPYIDRSKNRSISFDASLSYSGEQLTSSLNAFRRNEVTTDGTLRLSTQVELYNTWKASERTTLKLDLLWFQRDREIDLTTTSLEKEDIYLYRTEYRHRLTKHWTGSIRYQHRQRSVENIGSDASRNSVFLALTWTPTPKIW